MKNYNEWWKNIPVSINNAYGDPLTDIQIMDTYDKVKLLVEKNVKMSLCTKAVPTVETFQILENLGKDDRLRDYLFLQYSLTGLNEGGYSFDDRAEAIYRLFDIFGQMTLMLRPIIPGRNDSLENIEKIIKVAAQTGKRIVLGGIHNDKKRKKLDPDFKNSIVELCEKHGVTYFNKTACAAANQFGVDCWVHDLGEAVNLEILDKLGYKYDVIDGKIILEKATTGDLNFIRLVSKSQPYAKK